MNSKTHNNLTDTFHFAFNVWDFNSAKYIMDAACKIKKDVILQTSPSVFSKLPPKEFREFVSSYSKTIGINTWLNLDHCRDKNLLLEAVNNKWDMIMADASFLPIDENIKFTNFITELAHKSGVLIEAEIGQVMGIEDDIIVKEASIALRDDIKYFLERTDTDFLAVAFGNAHGEYKAPPKLDYELVEYTTSISDVSFVVHGGSGMSKDVLRRLIDIKGVKKINISTEVKQAYRQGIENAFKEGIFEQYGFQPFNTKKYLQYEFDALLTEKHSLIS